MEKLKVAWFDVLSENLNWKFYELREGRLISFHVQR
jgi:hypothetical protein